VETDGRLPRSSAREFDEREKEAMRADVRNPRAKSAPLAPEGAAGPHASNPSVSAALRRPAESKGEQGNWRAVFENAAIGVALTDLDGRFVAVNRAYESMLGYEEAELRQMTFLDLTHEDDRAFNWALVAELLDGRRDQFRLDKRYRRRDGGLIWVRTTASTVPGTGETGRLLLAVAEDITERKHADEELRRSEERWRTLLGINNAVITNLTQQDLLHAICDALQRVMPVYRAVLTLYQPERGTLRILAVSREWASAHFQAGAEFGRTDGPSAWVISTGRPLLRRDLEAERQYPVDDRLLEEGVRSYCIVPLVLGGQCIGTLNVGSEHRDQYSADDVAFLAEVATQVALAVGNMRAYEEIGALKADLQCAAERSATLLAVNNAIITHLTRDALLHSVSETLRQVIPFDRAAFTLYDPARETFRYLAMEGTASSDRFRVGVEFHRSESMAAQVFDQQRPVRRTDLEREQRYPNDRRLVAEGFKSDCLVPLIVGGRCIGTLNVASKTADRYAEWDLRLLQDVGNQVALAVENMQSYEAIAALKARLETENVYLQEEIRTDHNFHEIVGGSPALMAVLRKLEQVAPTNSTVLICGETGTGKELFARAIHGRSARKDRPLVKVNCSAISAGLVESELFGHVKGAFTGAIERRVGRFELADGGTIFLDEVGELPLETQAKLLRVLQEQEFEPVGSSRSLRVDVRVIAATNRDLAQAVRAGAFRSDLFYRLNVFPLDVPPLRERRSDVPQLAMFFLSYYAKKLGKPMEGISQDAMDRLVGYPWPGNVRELQNVIERAVILARGTMLEREPDLIAMLASDTSPPAPAAPADAAPAASVGFATLEEVERRHILAALEQAGGVVEGRKGAAKLLNLHPNTLRHRMDKLGIKRSTSRPS
jgi:formate hydrogenlyase transcriptional activator